MKKGVVLRSTGSSYSIESEGNLYSCKLKGKMRLQNIKSTNPVAVGDNVIFEVNEASKKDEGKIIDIGYRKNYIVRKSVNLSKQTQIIASNIDLALLMVTINKPKTYPIFIDRFLLSAEAYDIPVIILFNKIDSFTIDQLKDLESLKKIYDDIGYKTLKISAKKNQNIGKLKKILINKVSMISGNSGVGKSTFINALEPEINLKTASISSQHMQGKHTTTFAEMHILKNGIKIIDTPGIKGFGVVNIKPKEIRNYFPEIFTNQGKCKFKNCLHKNEPECAIIRGVEDGLISKSRYKSYIHLIKEGTNIRS